MMDGAHAQLKKLRAGADSERDVRRLSPDLHAFRCEVQIVISSVVVNVEICGVVGEYVVLSTVLKQATVLVLCHSDFPLMS
jgi:hypothetical protein